VHHWAGRVTGQRDGVYDVTHDVTPDPVFVAAHPDGDYSCTHLLEDCEFDELVVGRWLHVEQMGPTVWWMNIGGVTVHVTVDRDGRPTRVRVDGPGDYDTPVDGCTYEATWTASREQNQPARSGDDVEAAL
jgi:hypothetical protein